MTAKKYRIDVAARMVNAALVCVSTEETRYYLNGVHVEPHPGGGALLVATDGHRMLVIHDREGVCRQPAIIADCPDLRKALSRVKDEDKRLTVDRAGALVVDGLYQATENTLIDGSFPAWKMVLRPLFAALRKKSITPAIFNARYLADFAKVSERLKGRDSYPSVRVVSPTDHDAALIRFSGADYAFGALMPMRQSIPHGVPAFMPPVMRRPAGPPSKDRKLKAPARSK